MTMSDMPDPTVNDDFAVDFSHRERAPLMELLD
jgi:hypothetical protein